MWHKSVCGYVYCTCIEKILYGTCMCLLMLVKWQCTSSLSILYAHDTDFIVVINSLSFWKKNRHEPLIMYWYFICARFFWMWTKREINRDSTTHSTNWRMHSSCPQWRQVIPRVNWTDMKQNNTTLMTSEQRIKCRESLKTTIYKVTSWDGCTIKRRD